MARTIKTSGTFSIIQKSDDDYRVVSTDSDGVQHDMETVDPRPLTLSEAEDFLDECIENDRTIKCDVSGCENAATCDVGCLVCCAEHEDDLRYECEREHEEIEEDEATGYLDDDE
jgi:hypothetical protein